MLLSDADTISAFREAFHACDVAGLIFANPRFAGGPPEFGNAMSWEQVEACGQFRIKDLGRGGSDDGIGIGSGSHDSGGAALVLEVEVRSVMHCSCPMTRADIVAGGGTVDTPPALANWPPLQPPPHAKPGVVRIPHGRGGFGEAARALAAERQKAGGKGRGKGGATGGASGTGGKKRATASPGGRKRSLP